MDVSLSLHVCSDVIAACARSSADLALVDASSQSCSNRDEIAGALSMHWNLLCFRGVSLLGLKLGCELSNGGVEPRLVSLVHGDGAAHGVDLKLQRCGAGSFAVKLANVNSIPLRSVLFERTCPRTAASESRPLLQRFCSVNTLIRM